VRGERVFLKYLSRIVLVYLVWSIVYYILDFVIYGHQTPVGYTVGFWLRFLYNGTYYHFWYFPALIFAVCLSTLFFRLGLTKLLVPFGVLLYGLGCLSFSYHAIGAELPVMRDVLALRQIEVIREVIFMGFPLFVLGYLAYNIKTRFLERVSKKGVLILWAVFLLLWLAEMQLIKKMQWQLNFEVTLMLYPFLVFTLLLLCKFPLSGLEKTAGTCRVLANYTYYSHPLFIVCLQRISDGALYGTPLFLLVLLICLLSGFGLYKLNNRFINTLIS